MHRFASCLIGRSIRSSQFKLNLNVFFFFFWLLLSSNKKKKQFQTQMSTFFVTFVFRMGSCRDKRRSLQIETSSFRLRIQIGRLVLLSKCFCTQFELTLWPNPFWVLVLLFGKCQLNPTNCAFLAWSSSVLCLSPKSSAIVYDVCIAHFLIRFRLVWHAFQDHFGLTNVNLPKRSSVASIFWAPHFTATSVSSFGRTHKSHAITEQARLDWCRISHSYRFVS